MSEPSSFAFFDLKTFFRKKRKKLFFLMTVFFFLSFLFLLSLDVRYLSVGMFKDIKQKQSAEKVFDISIGKNTSGSIAAVMMSSKKILIPVIKQLGLQVDVDISKSLLQKGYNNLLAEFNMPIPQKNNFLFKDVIFNKNIPFKGFIKQISNDRFKILSQEKKLLGEGLVSKRYIKDDFSFTLKEIPKEAKKGILYPIVISPIENIIKRLEKRVRITQDKTCPEIINITYHDKDPNTSKEVVNHIMQGYQEYLLKECQEISNQEMAYFKDKQKQLEDDLNRALDSLCRYQKNKMANSGYISLEKELNTLMTPYQKCFYRLSEIELEIAKLSNYLPGLSFSELSNNPFFSDYTKQIEKLKCEKDLIDLSLVGRPKKVIASLKLFQEKDAPFSVELDGLSLDVLQNTYQRYCQKLEEKTLILDQLLYVKDSLNNPLIDLSSFSKVLKDSVSLEHIKKSAELSLMLLDKKNIREKEKNRIENQLSIERNFLSSHVDQTHDLQKREKELLQKNKQNLLRVISKHMGQKISLFDTQVNGLICQSKRHLEKEKQIILDTMGKISTKLTELPEKWSLEKKLKLKTDLAMQTIKSIANASEARAVATQLMQIESKPIDFAQSPYLPERPYLFAIALLISLAFGILFFIISIFRASLKGFPLSVDALIAYQQKVCGNLSSKDDLEILRKAAYFITQKNISGKVISLLLGQGADYSDSLCKLLKKNGCNTVVIQCFFDKDQENKGYLQHLEGKKLHIEKHQGYDLIVPGRKTDFLPEIISSVAFIEFISTLKKTYDTIILTTKAESMSAEAQVFRRVSNKMIISVQDECYDQVMPYVVWTREKVDRDLSFIVVV